MWSCYITGFSPIRIILTFQRAVPAAIRPGLSHQRTPSTGLARTRTNSFRTPPSSNASPRSASPAKLPVTSVPTPAPRTNRPGLNSPTKRTPHLSLQPRKSLALRQSPQDFPVPPSPSPQNGEFVNQLHSVATTNGQKTRRTSSPLALPPATPPPPLQMPPISFQTTLPTPRPPSRPPSSLNNPIVRVYLRTGCRD